MTQSAVNYKNFWLTARKQFQLVNKSIIISFCLINLLHLILVTNISQSRPLFAVILGCVLFLTIGICPCKYLISMRYNIILVIFSLVLMLLPFLLGEEVYGARRWILGKAIQPSELYKPVLALWLANSLYRALKNKNPILLNMQFSFHFFASLKWKTHILPFLSILLPYIIGVCILVAQRDVSALLIVTSIVLIMFFIINYRLVVFFFMLISFIFASYVTTLFLYNSVTDNKLNIIPVYIQKRIQSHKLDPSIYTDVGRAKKDLKNSKFCCGRSFNDSPKINNFKASQSDFPLVVISYNFGHLFSVFAILIYFSFILFIIVSLFYPLQVSNIDSILLCAGLAFSLLLQLLVHIAGNVSLIPFDGINIPYISIGGSGIIGFSISMGLVLSFLKREYE